MKLNEILHYRLCNQQIAGTSFTKPDQLIGWLCGIQGQDYGGSKWAIGVRLQHLNDIDIEQAIANRSIIRTWLFRGTLHIAAGKDIHWLLEFLAPRIIKSFLPRYKKLELDDTTFKRSRVVLMRSLDGNKQLTREEIAVELNRAGIITTGQRLPHILQRAALERIICFGARRGNVFTYTLLNGPVRTNKYPEREEAVAEIVRRYFTSRGPATVQDFTWWSGLATTDTKRGLEIAKSSLNQEIFNGEKYWMPLNMPIIKEKKHSVFLLPPFDEYVLAYKDRNIFIDAKQPGQVISSNGIFHPVIVVNGCIAGTWKRTLKKNNVVFETNPFIPFNKSCKKQIVLNQKRYSIFVNKNLDL